MIYRVWGPTALTMCPDWSVANAVAEDYQKSTDEHARIERDESMSYLRLDFGGSIWSGAEEIKILLNPEAPAEAHVTLNFWAHQLISIYDQVRTNHALVEETGYVRLYGNVYCVCLSAAQAKLLWDNLKDNYDMYKILEAQSRDRWNKACKMINDVVEGVSMTGFEDKKPQTEGWIN